MEADALRLRFGDQEATHRPNEGMFTLLWEYTHPWVVVFNGTNHLSDNQVKNASSADAFAFTLFIPNPIEPNSSYGNSQRDEPEPRAQKWVATLRML